jgi:hypothetical protein
MKIFLTHIYVLILFFSGCVRNVEIKETIPENTKSKICEKISFWLDEETSTVHKMISEGREKKIVSIIKYHHGKSIEIMKIVRSDCMNGRLRWIYFVPSTKYVIELTEVLTSDSEISFEWKNRNSEGEEDSGSDKLIECSEQGFIAGKENDEPELFK